MTIQELEKTQEGAGQDAIGSIPSDDLNITAPGKLRIIKRNGKTMLSYLSPLCIYMKNSEVRLE